ncbi:MAG: hypothetical protein QNJ17_00470 [Desulfocapsaceae bacterium]|nr:hypothetical protein [Desulfocapsaceae bacterium]
MTQEMLAARITLTPRPTRQRKTVLEVAMLGHCPGPVRLERLLARPGVLEEMRSVGFGEAVDQLQSNSPEERVENLDHLPVPLRSSAEFHDIFPLAGSTDTDYQSILAGKRAWLPSCVDDFFANGGQKLWVIKVPEQQRQQGFFDPGNTNLWVLDSPDTTAPPALPSPQTELFHDTHNLRGLATALVIPNLGTVAFPDLERLQIPAQLPDIPRVRLDNPDPQFLPCAVSLADDHRERRNTPEMESSDMPSPAELSMLLQRILPWLIKYRPDIQCLLTLPLTYDTALGSPVASNQALDLIRQIRGGSNGNYLRNAQFLFPYLRRSDSSLTSPVGVIAGKQASQAQTHGPWRSIAAQPLETGGLPFPPMSIAETIELRQDPGISVLQQFSGRVQLDDERLVVPALPPEEYGHAENIDRFDGYRSAEIMRLLSYLRRQLQRLGEQLVFNLDYRDPRPKLLLERFFRQLQQRGGLRGTTAEEGFHIEEIDTQEGAMIYEIMIAPALPIDSIHLTFTNVQGEWRGEVKNV